MDSVSQGTAVIGRTQQIGLADVKGCKVTVAGRGGPSKRCFVWAPKLLNAARMTIELVSKTTGKALCLSAKAFSKLLHVAKQNGWQPERSPQDWPEASWDTEVFLPYVDCYIPGLISATEAQSLKCALIKASGTGQFAFDGSLRLASEILLQVARQGAFRVRQKEAEPVLQFA